MRKAFRQLLRDIRARRRRDPDAPLRHEIAKLRRTASDDPAVVDMCNNVEELIAKGWTVRACNANPAKVNELRPEWNGKVPPEPGEE